MGNQPRRHHFVPQFYLAGFTLDGTANGALHVLDKEQLKRWRSTPQGTAHKRDFHAIDAGPGGDPMYFEKGLSKLEGHWSTVLREVVETEAIPDGDPFDDLMMFIAFQGVRVTGVRDILSSFINDVSKQQIRMTLATAEGRAGFRQVLEQDGGELTDDEFEQLVEFGRREEFDVDFEQTWHVQQIVRSALGLAPLLSQRKWCLWVCEDDSPDLICSDRPVAATWAVPMPGLMRPAFGTPNTIVSVPLNRRMAMVSMIEEKLPEQRLDRAGVAAVNSMTAMYGNRIFSPESDFVWTMRDYQIGDSEALVEALRRDREQESGE